MRIVRKSTEGASKRVNVCDGGVGRLVAAGSNLLQTWLHFRCANHVSWTSYCNPECNHSYNELSGVLPASQIWCYHETIAGNTHLCRVGLRLVRFEKQHIERNLLGAFRKLRRLDLGLNNTSIWISSLAVILRARVLLQKAIK